MSKGFSRSSTDSVQAPDGGSSRKRGGRGRASHLISWWRLVPAVLVALAAVAVLPTRADAAPPVPPTTWNNVTPASGSPAGLSNASMTNDITDGGSLLFGGEDSSGTFQNGTWI